MNETPAIQASHITKQFGTTTAVNDLNLTVQRGEIVALLGLNGAGKTTFSDIILGLQNPTKGTINIFGLDPHQAVRRSLVGAMLQSGALPRHATVEDTVRLFAGLHSHPLPIDTIMEESDLVSLARRPLSKLSGGELQRVRLALALAPNPQLLLLDEPTAGMDAVARARFWEMMRTQARAGRTILFATHYLTEAQDFAQRLVIMQNGGITIDGETADVLAAGSSRTLSAHYASPAAPDSLRSLLRSVQEKEQWDIRTEDGQIFVHGRDIDPALRALAQLEDVRDFEIHSRSLDDIFASLTASEDEATATSPASN